MEERLQKILSASGVCSRRTAESYLEQGRVAVNGTVVGLGAKADPERDMITLDGEPIRRDRPRTYLMLNKPRGYVCTLSDEQGRRTVAQLVSGCGARVWPVGRLDLESEGLLLLTDDGALTNRLLHPSHRVEKEYLVWVQGELSGAIKQLRRPMTLEGERMWTDRVEQKGPCLLSIVIHQGKNRQIRRMCAAAGLRVTRLKRIREGALRLGDLPVGTWRFLTPEEVGLLTGTGEKNARKK